MKEIRNNKKSRNEKIRKIILVMLIAVFYLSITQSVAHAVSHTVIKGESMWIIAKKYQVGLSEIINANKNISNPNLIYPGQILEVPLLNESITSFEEEVIRLTNLKRTANGLKELTSNWELSRVARYKSQDMRDNSYFSHTSPTYGSPFDMIKNFGITFYAAGENIAQGQRTPSEVVEAWWNSAGHRANILNANFNQIGVGYVSSGNYWTQMFIGK